MAVVLIGQVVQIRGEKSGDVGKNFLAVGVFEGMQHAVVGIDEDNWRSGLVGVVERLVVGSADGCRRFTLIGQSAVDDVAQNDVTRTEQIGWRGGRNFLALVATQVIQSVAAQCVDHACQRFVETILVRLRQVGPYKIGRRDGALAADWRANDDITAGPVICLGRFRQDVAGFPDRR